MRSLLLLIIIASNFKVYSNGGPIDGSSVYKTGDIILVNQPNIELLQEDLKITIDGDYSFVSVTYKLKSNNYSDSDITYGFPIQFIRDEVNYDLKWKDEYLPSIEFLLDGEKLEIKHQVDIATQHVKTDYNGGMSAEMRKSWHVVDFNIPKEKTVILKVNYKIKNGYQDWSTTKNFFPSFGERKLVYDFSPAKKWGDGTVSTLNVELNAKDIIESGGSISISGLELTNNAGIYSSTFNNFNLAQPDELEISYSNEVKKLSNYILNHRVNKKYIKSITATSQLEGNYEVNNLTDLNYNTAWVEGKNGDGIGEKIVINLEDYPLAAICLINGYTKNKGTYTTNNKIKKLRIEREIVDYEDSTKTNIESREILLDDLEFKEVSNNNLSEMMSIVEDYGEGFSRVRKITLTILEVHKGSKYSDTCVSEVLLMGFK
ncbi:NADase-type glycan-binding domain-containing protein [Marivirga sp.]|uniref:NADase-type glycan-binding domain-containing protein n=1 Tax=Marivirga sp. TaxID=2018662 RepID=UPI002D7E72D5|nr:hypothetical protein [Marivirga sp.]HET8859294.1 hypothetical protein [Marivirga sp.]